MPTLTNPKHERFAQALAKGMTATDAYAEAGYKPHDSNAARLSGNDRIQTRVAELLERAAARVEVTVATITERLLGIAEKGEKSQDAPMLSVARAALMDAAKLNGLVVDKTKNEHSGRVDYSNLTEEEIDARIAALVVEHRPQLPSAVGAEGDAGAAGSEGGEGEEQAG